MTPIKSGFFYALYLAAAFSLAGQRKQIEI
jgi:hypothetical protein